MGGEACATKQPNITEFRSAIKAPPNAGPRDATRLGDATCLMACRLGGSIVNIAKPKSWFTATRSRAKKALDAAFGSR